MSTNRSHALKNTITATESGKLIWNQEAAILDTTELICELMEEAGVSRSELARRMGTTKGYITQLLDGTTNMTIRTVSDVFTHLGHEFAPACKARDTARDFVVFAEFGESINVPDAGGSDIDVTVTGQPSGAVVHFNGHVA